MGTIYVKVSETTVVQVTREGPQRWSGAAEGGRQVHGSLSYVLSGALSFPVAQVREGAEILSREEVRERGLYNADYR